MSSKEKENLICLVSTLILSVPYMIYVYLRFQNSTFTLEQELKYWASSILLIIPIRIVIQVLVHMVFSIITAIMTGEKEEKEIVDERDKLIELKGDRNTTNIFTFGMIFALLSVVLGGSISTMFTIMFLSGFLGEILGILSKVYYYRQGL